MAYISRGSHDLSGDRRRVAQGKADYYDSLMPGFREWAKQHGKSEAEIREGLTTLERLRENALTEAERT